MIDIDSKKGRCTSAFGIYKEDDMQKQQKKQMLKVEDRIGEGMVD